jgi:Ca2+-transporting ATPase
MAEWKGLTPDEAAQRLHSAGFNELPAARRRNFLALAMELLREPMILLLLASGSVYVVLGEPREAALLLGSIAL